MSKSSKLAVFAQVLVSATMISVFAACGSDKGPTDLPPPPPPQFARDTLSPEVSFSSPAPGAVVSGEVVIEVTVVDRMRTAADTGVVDSLKLYIDSLEVEILPNAQKTYFRYLWDTRNLSNRTRHLEVVARDSAGNLGRASVGVTTENTQPGLQFGVDIWACSAGTDNCSIADRATVGVGVPVDIWFLLTKAQEAALAGFYATLVTSSGCAVSADSACVAGWLPFDTAYARPLGDTLGFVARGVVFSSPTRYFGEARALKTTGERVFDRHHIAVGQGTSSSQNSAFALFEESGTQASTNLVLEISDVTDTANVRNVSDNSSLGSNRTIRINAGASSDGDIVSLALAVSWPSCVDQGICPMLGKAVSDWMNTSFPRNTPIAFFNGNVALTTGEPGAYLVDLVACTGDGTCVSRRFRFNVVSGAGARVAASGPRFMYGASRVGVISGSGKPILQRVR